MATTGEDLLTRANTSDRDEAPVFALFVFLRRADRPYSRSEVIHRAGDESIFPAFERERPRIVNNFAASASSGYELSSFSEKMNRTRLSNLTVVLESGNEYSDEDESSLRRLLLAIRNSHPARAARTTSKLPSCHGKA